MWEEVPGRLVAACGWLYGAGALAAVASFADYLVQYRKITEQEKKGDHRRDNRVYFHHTAEEGTGREGTAVFSRGDEALREVFLKKKAAGVLTPGVRSIRLDTLTPVGSAGRHRIFETQDI